ncbi:MAG: hypothetical protein ABR998_00295 [Gemmatimonadales bacterium]
MSAPRPLPWTALIAALGEATFEGMRAALAKAAADPFDRDAFLLDGAVGRVLRDLVPADAPAEAVTGYGALLHALYLHWSHGSPVRVLERGAATALLSAPPDAAALPAEPPVAYVQLPERLVWAASAPSAPHEPMDGVFVIRSQRRCRALAVLGFRPDRQGFTAIEAEAPLPPRLEQRPDGSPPFATVLPAGDRVGLFSVTSPSELALLALLALSAAQG